MSILPRKKRYFSPRFLLLKIVKTRRPRSSLILEVRVFRRAGQDSVLGVKISIGVLMYLQAMTVRAVGVLWEAEWCFAPILQNSRGKTSNFTIQKRKHNFLSFLFIIVTISRSISVGCKCLVWYAPLSLTRQRKVRTRFFMAILKRDALNTTSSAFFHILKKGA